jgi:hypothetical protein
MAQKTETPSLHVSQRWHAGKRREGTKNNDSRPSRTLSAPNVSDWPRIMQQGSEAGR